MKRNRIPVRRLSLTALAFLLAGATTPALANEDCNCQWLFIDGGFDDSETDSDDMFCGSGFAVATGAATAGSIQVATWGGATMFCEPTASVAVTAHAFGAWVWTCEPGSDPECFTMGSRVTAYGRARTDRGQAQIAGAEAAVTISAQVEIDADLLRKLDAKGEAVLTTQGLGGAHVSWVGGIPMILITSPPTPPPVTIPRSIEEDLAVGVVIAYAYQINTLAAASVAVGSTFTGSIGTVDAEIPGGEAFVQPRFSRPLCPAEPDDGGDDDDDDDGDDG